MSFKMESAAADLIEQASELNQSIQESALKLLIPKRAFSLERLGKQMKVVTDLLQSNNVEMVNQEMIHLDQRLFEFMEINERYEGIVDANERNEAAKLANDMDSKVFTIKGSVSQWLKQQDSASSKHSGRSSHSSKSKGSSKSNVSIASVENKVQLESMKVQASILENELDYEVKKFREQKQDDVKSLKQQIILAETRQKVFDSQETRFSKNLNNITTRKHQQKDLAWLEGASNVNQHAGISDRLSKMQEPAVLEGDVQDQRSADISDTMVKMLNVYAAPTTDIDVFDGKMLEYEYFRATFTDVVESKISDQKGRLVRLIKYTSGEAKDLIKEFIHEDPTICYDLALKALDEEFGNPRRLTAAYLKELALWPSVRYNDAKAYRKMYRFLLKCQIIKKRGKLASLDSFETIRTIIAKFNSYIQSSWNRVSHKIMERENRDVDFDDLVTFIKEQSSLVNNPNFSSDALSDGRERRTTTSLRACTTQIDSSGNNEGHNSCYCCQSTSHKIDLCPKMITMDMDARQNVIRTKKLCFGCLQPTGRTHYFKICRNRMTCNECGRNHPSILHDYHRESRIQTTSSNATQMQQNSSSEQCIRNESNDSQIEEEAVTHSVSAVKHLDKQTISLCVVPVYLYAKGHPERKFKVYAMLDSCSQGTFIAEDLIGNLNSARTRPTNITVKTINGEESTPSIAINDLVVVCVDKFRDRYNESEIELPTAYTQSELPFGASETPSPAKLERWSHLKEILPFIPDIDQSIPVGLLIGGNCVKAVEPCDTIPSENGGPCAIRTKLGWCIVGPMDSNGFQVACNFIGSTVHSSGSNNPKSSLRHVYNDIKDDSIHTFLEEMYNIEFVEDKSEKKAMSRDDESFLNIMNNNISTNNNHYVLPLPFRNENVNLPNNKVQAIKRCGYVKKKMLRDEKYANDYRAFMNQLIEKGYAKEANSVEPIGKTWYLPHHGVYHPKKNKIRVVFDAAASFNGFNLNKELMSGPDLTSSLMGVLLRFRKGLVPFTADIESMFYQVKVPTEQQSFLRFLWWPDGNLETELKTYEMLVHIFGASSSPGCANYALRRTAIDHKENSSVEAVNTLLEDFYVDDLLKSVDSISEAASLVIEVDKLCTKSGFNLTKFVSTCPEILDKLPPGKRAEKTSVSLEINASIERALGVVWCLESDCLTFRIELKDTPLSRRGILSSISSIFDPLGFASPFMLQGKRILQAITGEKKGWDEPLSESQIKAWERWRNEIMELETIKLSRCYKKSNKEIVDNSIHCFSDASDIGYGNACYLRHVYIDGEIDVSLVLGKSRVAPLKGTTTPRLELTAATTSVKLAALLTEELKIEEITSIKFLTDSKIVLGYINNSEKRFRVYVSNRLRVIHDYSSSEQWNHVPTELNPADYGSRGIRISDKKKVETWLYGPPQLKELNIMESDLIFHVDDNDPEVQCKTLVMSSVLNECDILSVLENSCSTWLKMKRVMAWVLRFIQLCKQNKLKGGLSVSEVISAEETIIKLVQFKDFYTKKNEAKSNTLNLYKMKDKSRIRKLDPIIDDKGVLRVGGRLHNMSIDLVKHPIILSKESMVSKRIVEHFHKISAHSGRTTTISSVREYGFWIIGVNSLSRKVIFHCTVCRKSRGNLGEQKMADLPKDCGKTEGPFVYSGVDMFGPFHTKIGRKVMKRHVALFICLSSKAIHLEGVHEMSTDSFINALRRFLARRGHVRVLRADNGTNFVGTENEFLKESANWNTQKISDFLSTNNCDLITWKRNPPLSSHRGGVWERSIRTVRAILNNLFNERAMALDDELFFTFLCEAESIVNSRPLTVESLNDNDMEVLTPNHILTMKPKLISPPPGNFESSDLYCRKRWRTVQYLADQFWSRWRKEYLSLLQNRQKWNNVKRNFVEGDIVIMYDDSLPRNKWPLAKVIHVEYHDDGLVRAVEVKTAEGNIYKRPIQKIVLLVEA